jgi:hypothetical protein
MHEKCCLGAEAEYRLGRQYMVCGPRCEAQAKKDLSTEQLLGHVQVMALGPEPKSNERLLKTDIADLKRAQVSESRQSVCSGKRVLWIYCVDTGSPLAPAHL